MKYNLSVLGERIFEERNKLRREDGKPFSQEDLINALDDIGVHVGRNTISGLESGSKDANDMEIKLSQIIGLCTVFQCDIGYLLGGDEYETSKTAAEKVVVENTGLSHTAARVLMAEKREIDKIVSTPAGFLFHWSDNLFGVVSFLLENSANGSGGLLDLIRAYLTTPENATIQGLPNDTITVKGRRGFHVSAPQLLSGVLLDRIQQTLIEYRLQLQKRKKAKK